MATSHISSLAHFALLPASQSAALTDLGAIEGPVWPFGAKELSRVSTDKGQRFGQFESIQQPWQTDALATEFTAQTEFGEAANRWMASRTNGTSASRRKSGYIRRNTEMGYKQYIRSLNLFFNGMRLCDIRLNHIAKYQSLRVQGDAPFIRKRRPQDKEVRPCPTKPKKVNQELGILFLILKRVNLWPEEQRRLYEPLIEDIVEVKRALTPEDQRHWLDVARSNPRWDIVHWYSLVAFDTCMGTNEMRALRLRDINIPQRMLTVSPEGAKNQYRHRTIPVVSESALWAVECLIRRAHGLGSREPHHYLFPWRISRVEYDPNRPGSVSFIKKSWEEVRIASKLTWFRQYDLRHTAITRLAEGDTPFAVIRKRAGHVSNKMTEHYTHISDHMHISSVRAAQQFNGGLRSHDEPATYRVPHPSPFQPSPVSAPPATQSVDLQTQILFAMQQQISLITEQMRSILAHPASDGRYSLTPAH